MSERKLNIDGAIAVLNSDESKATYKAIAEEENGLSEKDGADEKLLEKSAAPGPKLTTKVEMTDDKYVVSDHRNGDAKLELDAGKTFTGLTKEELMKYANDPFWVRLRWAMFALFWIAWLAMLAGAIAIIVQAPKCPAPEPRKWFEIGPLVETEASTRDLDKFFEALKERRVQGVLVPSNLSEMDTYKVLDENYTPNPKFTVFAAKAKEYGIRLIMELTANYVNKTSDWFVKSEARDPEFESYFIWAPAKHYDGENPVPPNNWVSVLNEPAWTWSEKRREFYLHQFSAQTPDLNLTNPDVEQHFEGVIKFWRAAGVTGFRLAKSRQLLIDRSLRNETISERTDAVVGTYNFLNHKYTSDRPELMPLIAKWKGLLKDVDGFVTVADPIPPRKLTDANGVPLDIPNGGVVDIAAEPEVIKRSLQRLAGPVTEWPTFRFLGEIGRESELLLVSLLLPATPILTDQQLSLDLGSGWKGHADYSLLLDLRNQPSTTNGNTSLHVLGNQTAKVFAYSRQKAGTSAHLVVWNPNPVAATVSAGSVLQISPTLTTELLSANYVGDLTKNSQIGSENITLSAKSAVLFSYAPVVIE